MEATDMSFEYERAVATAHQSQDNAIIQMVKFALWKYHNALDLRKNGDVAAHHLKNDIEAILGTPWVQGKTLGLSHGEDSSTVKTST